MPAVGTLIQFALASAAALAAAHGVEIVSQPVLDAAVDNFAYAFDVSAQPRLLESHAALVAAAASRVGTDADGVSRFGTELAGAGALGDANALVRGGDAFLRVLCTDPVAARWMILARLSALKVLKARGAPITHPMDDADRMLLNIARNGGFWRWDEVLPMRVDEEHIAAAVTMLFSRGVCTRQVPNNAAPALTAPVLSFMAHNALRDMLVFNGGPQPNGRTKKAEVEVRRGCGAAGL